MKNVNTVILLLEKATQAFGVLLGITPTKKTEIALNIIQKTILESYGIIQKKLSKKELEDILMQQKLEFDQVYLLANLLMTQGELLLKLNRPLESLIQFENTLLLMKWQEVYTPGKINIERKNKISTLEAITKKLKKK